MEQIYTWNWKSGGYNCCTAGSLEEAKTKAADMGAPTLGWLNGGPGTRLVPDPASFRAVTQEEMDDVHNRWRAILGI